MARLISLYRDDAPTPLGRRELPLPFDENISVKIISRILLH
jgi:hypothetical protein